ncbi:MAG TPA: DUF4129 domain-containing protein, partial [Thermodesulfobacteriota bacterium]|nr:DUF4129 domain-containing protein [Thermodesulfobacteriota bacterium]
TPREYLSTLSEWIPGCKDDVALITDEYVRVRYGGILPGEMALEQLTAAWKRIRENARRAGRKKNTATGD